MPLTTEPGSNAVVYRYGAPLAAPPGSTNAPTATVFINDTKGFHANERGKKVATVDPPKHVDGVAIGLDLLLCLTIVGIAAPISDAVMGTFSKVDDRVAVHLEPDPEEGHPLPVYAVAGTTIAATEAPPEPPAAAEPAPASAPAPVPPANPEQAPPAPSQVN